MEHASTDDAEFGRALRVFLVSTVEEVVSRVLPKFLSGPRPDLADERHPPRSADGKGKGKGKSKGDVRNIGEPYLDKAEVVKITGYSIRKIDRLIKSGKLKSFGYPRGDRFTRFEIDRLMASRVSDTAETPTPSTDPNSGIDLGSEVDRLFSKIEQDDDE